MWIIGTSVCIIFALIYALCRVAGKADERMGMK